MLDLEQKLNVSASSEVASMSKGSSRAIHDTELANLNVARSMSVEIVEPSFGGNTSMGQHKNSFLGYLFMGFAVIGFTMSHTSGKIAFTRKPSLTNVDVLFSFGIWMPIIYFIWSRLVGVTLSFSGLPRKPFIGMLFSL